MRICFYPHFKHLPVAYRFTSPPNGCFGSLGFRNPHNRYTPARTGRFLVEDPGGHVIRFEAEAAGFPEDFGLDRSLAVESGTTSKSVIPPFCYPWKPT